MSLRLIQTLLCYFAYVLAFEDVFYVYGQGSQEMQEQGRAQYQLLQERGHLPKYGDCWKDAIKHINEGCRSLSEETQSEVALHLSNCFLMMSGHDTYDCQFNKKPNLRAICINSMSDRAFNVYTEFYTHTQNICWFLRGQIWHETIVENTWKVSRKLEDSAKNQEEILKNQKESLELQERLMEYGNALEKSMEKFYKSSRDQQEILNLFSSSISNLQSWLLGELSWFDTLVFYTISSLFVIFFTSVPRTSNARLVMLIILTLNTFLERLISYLLSRNFANDILEVQNTYNFYVWCLRYTCMLINVIILITTAISYRNLVVVNTKLLTDMYNKIITISEKIDFLERKPSHTQNENISCVSECYKSPRINYLDVIKSNLRKESDVGNGNCSIESDKLIGDDYDRSYNNSVKSLSGRRKLNTLREIQNCSKYNLRSRNGTPDIM